MRFAVAMAMAGLVLFGFGRTVPQLPPWEMADTEVSVCQTIDQGEVGVCGLDFRLEFSGTASNNVEVVLGRDVDGDGNLSFEESGIRVGWDCGRYFIERVCSGERFDELTVGTNGQERILGWTCAVKRHRMRGLAVTNEVGGVFTAITAEPPEWLYDPSWNLMRLTARGTDVLDEHFDIDVRNRGFLIHLR